MFKMSNVHMVRALVNQRLAAAAEEIFGLFERTIADYEEELCRSKEKNERQKKLLDAWTSKDIQQLVVVKEEVPPEQQEWIPSLDQEDPPEPPHIKEEQEELWTSQEGKQLQGLEEADITKFLFTPVPVKSEDDEDKPQSSQLHQRQTEEMETGADGEDCGGPEPARNSHQDTQENIEYEIEDSHPDPELGPVTEDKIEEIEESEVYSKETREPQSGLNFQKSYTSNTDERPFSCAVCRKTFKQKKQWKEHLVVHTEEKPFSCSFCGKRFKRKVHMKEHMAIHTGVNKCSCPVCGKSLTDSNLTRHMWVHTGESPFSCSTCDKGFTGMRSLKQHMAIHTGEKRFSCSGCEQRFTWDKQLRRHKRVCRQSSQLHQTEQNREAEPGASSSTEQMETGADGEDCGGPEPARSSHPVQISK